MSEPVDEIELKRREYELKRQEFLQRLEESNSDRLIKVATTALFGHIGALVLFATLSKSDGNSQFSNAFGPAIIYFTFGAFTGLLAFGGAWSMAWRNNIDAAELADHHFAENEALYEKWRPFAVLRTYLLIPWMTVGCIMISGALFIAGLVLITYNLRG
jgi:hypothetical protein